LPEATAVGGVLDEVRANWFEAPLDAEDVEGHATLARTIKTPIAIGETLRTPRQFEPWLRQRALAVAQPDLMRTGITGARRIAALASAHRVPTTLHIGVCTGIGMAATWQLASTWPGEVPQEHQQSFFPVANSVLHTPLGERGGRLLVPDAPGIGVDVNEAALRGFTTEHWVVDANGRRLD
jgi:L-alanine-DL-glutamate epimerase-like enolase superfamily enzyme